MNATNRAFVRPRLLLSTPRYSCTVSTAHAPACCRQQSSRHKTSSTGSVALCAPSSVLLMAKAVHARGLCALQSSSYNMYCSTVTECICIRERERVRERERERERGRERERERERGRESYLTYTVIVEERKGDVHVCMHTYQLCHTFLSLSRMSVFVELAQYSC